MVDFVNDFVGIGEGDREGDLDAVGDLDFVGTGEGDLDGDLDFVGVVE